jgi:hypothetical protein
VDDFALATVPTEPDEAEGPPPTNFNGLRDNLGTTRLGGAAEGIETTTATLGHWKLAAIDAYAGARPLAWIDDCLDAACHAWVATRAAPTLLVQTDAAVGITAGHVQKLVRWAEAPPRS